MRSDASQPVCPRSFALWHVWTQLDTQRWVGFPWYLLCRKMLPQVSSLTDKAVMDNFGVEINLYSSQLNTPTWTNHLHRALYQAQQWGWLKHLKLLSLWQYILDSEILNQSSINTVMNTITPPIKKSTNNPTFWHRHCLSVFPHHSSALWLD